MDRYESLEIEVIRFDGEDVIVTSDKGPITEGKPFSSKLSDLEKEALKDDGVWTEDDE